MRWKAYAIPIVLVVWALLSVTDLLMPAPLWGLVLIIGGAVTVQAIELAQRYKDE